MKTHNIPESLEENPNYERHFEHRGETSLLFLDLSNILCRAVDLGYWVNLKKLITIFDRIYDLKGHLAFTSCNITNGLVEFLYKTGYIVYQSPFDSDAIMGYKICELSEVYEVEVVVIGTHDGGFRRVSDQLKQRNIQVHFLGFRDWFSGFLRCEPLYDLEDLGVLEPMHEKGATATLGTQASVQDPSTSIPEVTSAH